MVEVLAVLEMREDEASTVNSEDREKFKKQLREFRDSLGPLQRYTLEGYREEWQPGLRPSAGPRKPRLTAADLVLLREMRIRL